MEQYEAILGIWYGKTVSKREGSFGNFGNNFKLRGSSLILAALWCWRRVAEMAATRPRSSRWPDPDAERAHTRAYTRLQQQLLQQQVNLNPPAPAQQQQPDPSNAATAGDNGKSKPESVQLQNLQGDPKKFGTYN